MRKIFFLLLMFVQSAVFANYNDMYIADIQYDWIDKSAVEKEAIISEIKDLMFEKELEVKPNLKSEFSEKLKDKERIEHYLAASAGRKEYKDYNISAFYYRNMKNIYMYAIQDKKDVSKAYYYDTLGKLRYVDYIHGAFPDYPYYAIQYKITGQPVSAIYYVSEDCQYLYKPNGDFEGVWYKHNLYNKESKIILKRSSY